jgi:hypothetical protein
MVVLALGVAVVTLTDVAGLACLGAAFALQKLRREAPLPLGAGGLSVSRARLAVPTVIAAALVLGTFVYGVLRLYA